MFLYHQRTYIPNVPREVCVIVVCLHDPWKNMTDWTDILQTLVGKPYLGIKLRGGRTLVKLSNYLKTCLLKLESDINISMFIHT